jgi:hypothetical protein
MRVSSYWGASRFMSSLPGICVAPYDVQITCFFSLSFFLQFFIPLSRKRRRRPSRKASYYSCPILTKLEFHRQVTAKNSLPKISIHCPMNAQYFDADGQTDSLTWRGWKPLFARFCERTSTRQAQVMKAFLPPEDTDNIQWRRVTVTWCPTYSLGLSIEVRPIRMC